MTKPEAKLQRLCLANMRDMYGQWSLLPLKRKVFL